MPTLITFLLLAYLSPCSTAMAARGTVRSSGTRYHRGRNGDLRARSTTYTSGAPRPLYEDTVPENALEAADQINWGGFLSESDKTTWSQLPHWRLLVTRLELLSGFFGSRRVALMEILKEPERKRLASDENSYPETYNQLIDSLVEEYIKVMMALVRLSNAYDSHHTNAGTLDPANAEELRQLLRRLYLPRSVLDRFYSDYRNPMTKDESGHFLKMWYDHLDAQYSQLLQRSSWKADFSRRPNCRSLLAI